MSDRDITTAIHDKLANYTLPDASAPYFAKVFKGPADGLAPIDKLSQWNYVRSREAEEGRATFGATIRRDIFRVKCFWTRKGIEGARENLEDDVYVIAHDLPGAFSGDSTLGGFVTDLDIPEGSKVTDLEPYPEVDGQLWRTLTFEIHVLVLEGEAIAA